MRQAPVHLRLLLHLTLVRQPRKLQYGLPAVKSFIHRGAVKLLHLVPVWQPLKKLYRLPAVNAIANRGMVVLGGGGFV